MEKENINWLNILSVYGKLLAETFGFFEKCGGFGNGASGLHHYDMLKLCIMPSLTRKKMDCLIF
jgi:hypothetical protein